MRKVLIGCGVLLALLMVGVGSCIFGGYKLMTTTFKDVAAASQAVQQMPVDRLEREAEEITAADFREQLPKLNSKPVKVTGKVSPWAAELKVTAQGAKDVRQYFFMEPAVLVYGYMMMFNAEDLPEGTEVEVLGVAARVDLNSVPFLDASARKRAAEALGGKAEIPVVVAARVMRFEEAPAAEPVEAKDKKADKPAPAKP